MIHKQRLHILFCSIRRRYRLFQFLVPVRCHGNKFISGIILRQWSKYAHGVNLDGGISRKQLQLLLTSKKRPKISQTRLTVLDSHFGVILHMRST